MVGLGGAGGGARRVAVGRRSCPVAFRHHLLCPFSGGGLWQLASAVGLCGHRGNTKDP